MNFKLKIYFGVFILVSLVLTILGFLTSLVCHSSVISLTALFHFSQCVFYTTKLYLITRNKGKQIDERAKNPSRVGVLIDLMTSTFISALCFSIIVKSIQYFFGHESIHDDKDDELHHDHENFTQYQKIMLMMTLGGLLLVCNLAFLLLTFKETVLRRSKTNEYRRCNSSQPASTNDQSVVGGLEQISFEPFGTSKIRLDNCFLIVPSDLVKMSRKFFFTVALMSGPLAVMLNSAVYMVQYSREQAENGTSGLIAINKSTAALHHDEHEHHHHHHGHDSNWFHTFINFLLINIDPILSIVLAIIYVVFFSKVFKLAAAILAQSVPLFVNVANVQRELKELVPSIRSFHEFYLFELTPFNLCVSMHFVMAKEENLSKDDEQRKMAEATQKIKDYFSNNYLIHSIAVQPELTDTDSSNRCCSSDECHIKPK